MSLCEMLASAPQWKVRRDLTKDYGELLTQRRKKRGVTLIELAVKTGISYEDIDLVEKGLLKLSVDEKEIISKFFKQRKIL
ncbi:MAG TPA: helix-turn-helix transcriptional regulator [Candidatus Omnitrophota bacterium]|nr:helix-turn-helix transcriptional regulator [Candidatus Omnitrophota bacterium]